jgi:hypothetical protein
VYSIDVFNDANLPIHNDEIFWDIFKI